MHRSEASSARNLHLPSVDLLETAAKVAFAMWERDYCSVREGFCLLGADCMQIEAWNIYCVGWLVVDRRCSAVVALHSYSSNLPLLHDRW